MRIVAFPAGEPIYVVYTLLEFHFNILEVILGKCFIVAMAIHAYQLLFHPGFDAMRKGVVIVRMAVVAGKAPVNRAIKSIPVNGTLGIHKFTLGPSRVGIFDGKFGFSVALQTGLVVFHVGISLEVRGF
jgi:hypothetical protein